MDIMIRALKPELSEDYFDFFDNRAFSDGSPYYPCYCNAFNMSAEQIKSEFFEQIESNGGGAEGLRLSQRKSAEKMLKQGKIQGYMAYENNIVIGWCNANDKNSYFRLGDFDLDGQISDDNSGDNAEKIKSIVCFAIAPGYRGKGIATALLERVCRDAAADGYEYVEVYPTIRDERDCLDFTGPIHLYEKSGFTCFSKQGNKMIMRKKLII